MFKPLSPKIEAVVNEHGKNPSNILEILVDLQTNHGGLNPETLDDLARSLDLPPARVYGIASFYSMLDISQTSYASKMPKVRVCDGPVCWICGANFESATKALEKHMQNGRLSEQVALAYVTGLQLSCLKTIKSVR